MAETMMTLILIAAFISSTAASGDSASRRDSFSWRTTDHSVALLREGRVLWRFRYAKEQDLPYFHPLATSTGQVLTWDAPPDHVWHHGLWFSWKYLNGVNYWEIDRKTGRPEGLTHWRDVRVETRENYSADISMTLGYRPAAGGEPVLEEERRIKISPPQNDGSYRIDWESRFTATSGDVLLDRTPPKERSSGGYAGLSIRLAKDLTERQAISSEGTVTFDAGHRYRGHAPAIDYSGRIDGQWVGVAFLDHPSNPRHPTPWYLIRSPTMGYINAALLNDRPLNLESGKSLVLRYRLIVHARRWNVERLRGASADFQSKTFRP